MVERANVTRLMRAHGIRDIDELRRRSVEDLEWFWDAVVADLGIPFDTPYERVLDDSAGPAFTTWFTGGRVNLSAACVGRWARDPDRAGATALVAESEDGRVRSLTHLELAAEVARLAAGLRACGIGPGDRVAAFLPMVAEAAVAAWAIAHVGAVYVPVFSGFAAGAVASRLADSGARMVLTADGALRRGRSVPLKATLDAALASCPAVERVAVLRAGAAEAPMAPGRDLWWDELLAAGEGAGGRAHDTASEDPWMIAYTSGTTGRPKGSVHVHGGFLVKIASEVAYQVDLRRGEALFWVTDMGWIMGPWSLVGAGALGGTMVMYDGAPDVPGPDRVWRIAARHRAAVVGVSPTLVRAMRARGAAAVPPDDLPDLRIIGSTGEPWNPEPYEWLAREVGRGRRPIVNFSGGTEVGACFLSPFPVEEIATCSLGGPALGMDVDVLDADGRPVRGRVGELVCRQPWPGMTRGVWGDRERYLASYWSTYPGIWRHGDWALVDDRGDWYLLGRSDEAISLAGKRLGPAEVESVLVGHPGVAEAAAVGIPDEAKGEALWCFWVGVDPEGPDASGELADRVAAELGRPFRPAGVVRVPALPRTRSAKILRRAVRSAALGEDPGDLSSAENPEALDGITAALAVARLRRGLEAAADPVRAPAMEAYMRNRFPFLGVPAPKRRAVVRATLPSRPRPTTAELAEVALACWRQPERELQQAAVDHLAAHAERAGPELLPVVERLIGERSWWDTVDPLAARVVGPLVQAHPELRARVVAWIDGDDMWLARAAILHQLGDRERTDAALLFDLCRRRAADPEFFIRKAIGWALRQHARTDPRAVQAFVAEMGDRLSPLSRREALRHVGPA